MADMNQICITGHLTRDAVVKVIGSGKTLLSFDIANNIGFGDYAKTNFYTVNMWGDRGTKIAEFLKKGIHVGVIGEESINAWMGKDGTQHQDRVITTMNITFLGGGKSQSNTDGGYGSDEQEDDGPIF